jgi:hypothetical protein
VLSWQHAATRFLLSGLVSKGIRSSKPTIMRLWLIRTSRSASSCLHYYVKEQLCHVFFFCFIDTAYIFTFPVYLCSIFFSATFSFANFDEWGFTIHTVIFSQYPSTSLWNSYYGIWDFLQNLPFVMLILSIMTLKTNLSRQFTVIITDSSDKQTNSVAFSPQVNYTYWATATSWRNLVPTFVDRVVSRDQCCGSRTVVNLSFLDRSC